jgi:glycosyltransferase involved in cell wall biosynthesis
MTYGATIVVPLLRQTDDWLEQSVRSALAQSVPTQVVVVRSASTPASNLKTLDKLQGRHANLEVICEQKHRSFPNAINTGIDNARADRIGLLLSDDWLDEGAVAACLRVSADIVSTGHALYFPNGRLNEAGCLDASMAHFQTLSSLVEKASYLEHFFLFRKEMLLRVGGLDESVGNYPGIDDFDLIWTMLEQGATVGILEQRLYHYRDHLGERLTLSDPAQSVRNLERILRKHGVSDEDARDIVKNHERWFGKPLYKVMDLDENAL